MPNKSFGLNNKSGEMEDQKNDSESDNSPQNKTSNLCIVIEDGKEEVSPLLKEEGKQEKIVKHKTKRRFSEADKLERLKQKELKEKLKIEEKDRKEKEKNDLKMKKETEKLEREKEKEDKRKQKEEEKKQKLEQAEEEKRKKEEARLQEKQKKELEKKKDEEKAEKKAAKEKQLMHSFFIKTTKDQITTPTSQLVSQKSVNHLFMPFEIKKNMRLAPSTRYNRSNIDQRLLSLDEVLKTGVRNGMLYLDQLKNKLYVPGKSMKTWPKEDDEDEVVVIPNDSSSAEEAKNSEIQETKLCTYEIQPIRKKMKFLQFHDNYRPAYYGTWRKKSRVLNGRRPFAKESKYLDYEVDSDEEWEEEEPGESIVNSEGEEENEGSEKAEEEVDDDFFVPHGYLSEGEGCDGEDDVSYENLKQMQLIKAKNFEANMKSKKIEKLRPIVYGLFWWNPCSEELPNKKNNMNLYYDDMLEFFNDFKAISMNGKFPIDINKKPIIKTSSPSSEKDFEKSSTKRRVFPVPNEAIPHLIKLVHGCFWSIEKMTREFKQFWYKFSKELSSQQQLSDEIMDSQVYVNTGDDNVIISKRQLECKIKEIALYKKDERYQNRLWYVNDEILAKYNLSDLPIPSAWEWSIQLPSLSNKKIYSAKFQDSRPVMNNEAKTPKISLTSCTSNSVSPSISKFLDKRSNKNISIRNKISPSYNAVLSESTARKKGSDSSRYPSESGFSPTDEIALGETKFAKEINDNKISDIEVDYVYPTPRSIKRSSDIEMGSDVKRSNNVVLLTDNDSQDCMIVDDPVILTVSQVTPLKCLNSEHLSSQALMDNLKSDIETKSTSKADVAKINNSGRENRTVSRELNFYKNSKVQPNAKTIRHFFNCEQPNNK